MSIVYFATCPDLVYEYTKIGSCNKWADRSLQYRTGFPLESLSPYCVILTEHHKLLEALFLKEFGKYSTTHHPNYVDGGVEWIDKILDIDDIKNTLNKYKSALIEYKNIHYELLYGWRLVEFLEKEEITPKHGDCHGELVDFLNFFRTRDNRKLITKNKTIALYDYQEEVFEKIDQYSKCIINWACGLGKTILTLNVAKRHKRVLIGVPSILLLKQWIAKIQEYLPHPILSVSGTSINGIKNTTSIDVINYWASAKQSYIMVTTYQSASKVAAGAFDLVILDECHHLCQTSGQYCKVLCIKSKKQISLTATMKAVDNCGDNFDENSFGKVIDTKSTLWAINNKYITDYEVITIRVEENNLSALMGEVLNIAEHRELFLAAFVILESMYRIKTLTHVIAYCNTCGSSEILSRFIDKLLVRRFGNCSFYNRALNSETPTDIQGEIKAFKESARGVISSVYIFGEGFDIPKVNGVCVAENMSSEIRIVQSMLRGNRLDKNDPEKMNRIILPYIENRQDTFEKVETVIAKMGNCDENITQRIRAHVINAHCSESEGREYVTDFNNVNELKYVKLRLRHRSAIRIPGLSYVKAEYDYLRSMNIMRKIGSKSEYHKNRDAEYIENPQEYFDKKDPTVWKSWYDFIGTDISKFPSNKDTWKEICAGHKITSRNYGTKWESCGLSQYPADLYKDFKNMLVELCEKKVGDVVGADHVCFFIVPVSGSQKNICYMNRHTNI